MILAAVFTATSMAFAANGKPFILGKNNAAKAVTTLVKQGPGPALRILVRPGQPPMAVNSSVRVANLNADKVDGRDAAAFLRYGEDIPSGETITGVFGGSEQDQSGAAVTTTYRQTVSFPVPAPDDLTDTTVNFAPNGFAGDDDATCTGNDENPTAPPGQVCIYFSIIPSGTNIAADSAVGEAIPSNNSRRGFVVKFSGFGSAGLAGTWAYTAP